jgi:2-polyprenyl-3-methyl-5-hydroxy-6-metoxy-1,4-benzoquinol methylase
MTTKSVLLPTAPPNTPEPSLLETVLARVLGATLLAPFYREYAQTLPLKGDEWVIDFGSGAGYLAREIAHRLRRHGGHVACVNVSARWIKTALHTLRHEPNVDFHQGRVQDLQIPDGCFDLAVLHFVLHDVPPNERVDTICTLAQKLVPGGSVCIREPANPAHGMSCEDIRQVMRAADLTERKLRATRHGLMGMMHEGVFEKLEAKGGSL